MKWHDHSRDLPEEEEHAFLGGSNYHWTNYDDEKLEQSYRSAMAKQWGTRLHEYAAEAIDLKRKQRKSNATLDRYINDAIGFNMDPEVKLKYSMNAYGKADSISFINHPDINSRYKYFLRIHDLKTGVTPAHLRQLEIYAAYFFLEYKIEPEDTEIELRIYQNDDVIIGHPEAKDIRRLMKLAIHFDKLIEKIKLEG